MLINSKSKEYLTKLLDDPKIAGAVDAENWDIVYKYFLHMLKIEQLGLTDKFEIHSDLTRFLLESGINPLDGRDHISGYTFYGEYDLEELPVIPSSIKKINSKAYTEVVTHEPMELTIPGTVEIVATYAFSECNDLTKLIVEDGVKEVDSYAISDCKNIAYIELPNSLTRLGYIVSALDRSDLNNIVVKFNGSADEFIKLINFSNSMNYFSRLRVLDKNNNQISWS